jgi:hypothetical protein
MKRGREHVISGAQVDRSHLIVVDAGGGLFTREHAATIDEEGCATIHSEKHQ